MVFFNSVKSSRFFFSIKLIHTSIASIRFKIELKTIVELTWLQLIIDDSYGGEISEITTHILMNLQNRQQFNK